MKNTPSSETASTVQGRINTILRYGRPPRTRAERQAEREVCYGDHLKTLLGEISAVTGDDPFARLS